jgi:hypothetical protein
MTKRNAQMNELIKLSQSQQNPGLARPEDFVIQQGEKNRETEFSGQHGDTA